MVPHDGAALVTLTGLLFIWIVLVGPVTARWGWRGLVVLWWSTLLVGIQLLVNLLGGR